MNWKVGDRAILVDDGHVFDEGRSVLGEEVVLLSPSSSVGYDWDVSVRCETWEVYASCLRPIYDGNETVSWEDCIWEPDKVTVELE